MSDDVWLKGLPYIYIYSGHKIVSEYKHIMESGPRKYLGAEKELVRQNSAHSAIISEIVSNREHSLIASVNIYE